MLAYWKEVDYLYSFAAYDPQITSILIPAYTGITRILW